MFGDYTAVTPLSLDIDIGLSFEEWERLGGILSQISHGSPWWRGDYWVFGEGRYGEKCYQAADEHDREKDKAYAWVSSRIPPATRREALSWSHHRVVAGLDVAEQDALLDQAEENGWSVRELRQAVRGEEPEEKVELVVTVERTVGGLPHCPYGIAGGSAIIDLLDDATSPVSVKVKLVYVPGDQDAD